MQGKAQVTLTVFWEGTGNTIVPITTQIGIFAQLTEGIDISSALDKPVFLNDGDKFKMLFHGCGVTHGCAGVIWAVGLRSQCRQVIDNLEHLVNMAGARVTCNVLGLSRGGCAAIFLAQMLAETTISTDNLKLNLLLFDPVPGNLIWTSRLDCCSLYTSTHCYDLKRAQHLRRVLALYPHEPLPDIAFHAPVLPEYPQNCQVGSKLACPQLLSPANEHISTTSVLSHFPSLPLATGGTPSVPLTSHKSNELRYFTWTVNLEYFIFISPHHSIQLTLA